MKLLKTALVVIALALAAGCSTGTYQRGMFQGYVVGSTADLAERLAIEQALKTRGYLRQTPGGWC